MLKLLFDGGSTDETVEIVESLGVNVVSLSH
jgi:glycosyltransferase involved in cell wall biosynthesis